MFDLTLTRFGNLFCIRQPGYGKKSYIDHGRMISHYEEVPERELVEKPWRELLVEVMLLSFFLAQQLCSDRLQKAFFRKSSENLLWRSLNIRHIAESFLCPFHNSLYARKNEARFFDSVARISTRMRILRPSLRFLIFTNDDELRTH